MHAALLNFEKQKGNKIAILGDMFELGTECVIEHQNIANLVVSLNIEHIILVGKNFYKVDIKSDRLKKYTTFADLEDAFHISKVKDSIILIKGSRGMALERLLN